MLEMEIVGRLGLDLFGVGVAVAVVEESSLNECHGCEATGTGVQSCGAEWRRSGRGMRMGVQSWVKMKGCEMAW